MLGKFIFCKYNFIKTLNEIYIFLKICYNFCEKLLIDKNFFF
jgi:hypothetical protein